MNSKASNFKNFKFENHKVPEFKEVKNKDWVYYGADNVYPEYLIQLALRSSKHNAILNGKVNYIYGGGLVASTKGVNYAGRAKANEFIRQVNEDGFLRKMIQDFEWFNGFYIEPIFNKAKTKLTSINYIPFSKIRTNEDESMFWFSNDWSALKQSEEKTGLKEYKPFDMESPSPNQLFYFKLVSPKNGKDKNVYPVPEYIGSTAAIETDIEIANYHLNNVKTGFSVGTIINFNNGSPGEEAQEEIEKGIKKRFQGTDVAGSVAITFNKSADNAPTITSFAPSDLDKQFIEIGKKTDQDIFTGHKITSPMLFGVKTEGQLGGRNEIIDAYELFQSTYVDVRQGFIEDVLNAFAKLFGVASKIELKRTQAVSKSIPDATLQRVYDSYPVEQLAEMAGLPKARKSIDASFENESEDLYEVLFEQEFTGQSDEDFLNEFQKMEFAKDLSENERAVIDLLEKDSDLDAKGISKVLNISEDKVKTIINDLIEGGYIGKDGATKKGAKEVDKDGAKTELFDIKYKYDWRPDVSPDKRSREDCKNWLRKHGTQNQAGWLSRTQIDRLNNGQGLGVWDSRGGFWNRNGNPVPFCRHIWKQMVVKKKK